MTIGHIFILAIIAGSLFLFSHRLLSLVRLINCGQGSFPVDQKSNRIKALLVKGFGQRLVLRKLSGIGHFFIFWGFFFFTFGTVEGLISSVFPGVTFAPLGSIYFFFNSGQDIFGALIFTALMISLYRRFIERPVRFEGTLPHTIDALVVITLIVVLIVLFYGMAIVAPKQGWMPVTDFLRELFLRVELGPATHKTFHTILEWTHNIVALIFLVYILYSKHSHIVFALPNIFLKQDNPPGLIEKLDLENDSVERFGVQSIFDFKKKDLLDLLACTECGRCQESCPAYVTGKPLSPKKVILDLKDHLLNFKPASLHDSESKFSKNLYPDIISGDMLWACTTCRACEEICPVENAPMSKIIEIRQANVLMEGDFPEKAKVALRNIETQSNPWGLPQEQRAQWAKGLEVKTLAENPDVEYLLFVGCAGAYDQRYISVTRTLVKLLQEANVRFGILGNEELCTGDSAKRIGNDYLAQELAHTNVSTFHRYGVKKIITACPHCFNTIKNEYPQYDGHFEVIHHSDLIHDLIQKGKLKPKKQHSPGLNKIAYHDSCYLGRYNQIMDSPRKIIAHAGSNELVELRRNRENSFCCGAGGGLMWTEGKIGTEINVERAREISKAGINTVATACPFCMNMLIDGLKQEHKAEEIKVIDIAEIVAASL